MNYLMTFTLIISLKGVTSYLYSSSLPLPTAAVTRHPSDCGIRPARRQPRSHHIHYNRYHHQQHQANNQFFYHGRIPKIIAGSPTKEGQFPWQASLELLHPSMGFLGHWCGGVLVDEFWVLSASHCVHNDLFNLPLPPLWTVVLGEYDRNIESGYEQRIPVEKIILHQNYQHFLHDLVLMKLSIPADLSRNSNIRKICLPFVFDESDQSYDEPLSLDSYSSEEDNFFPTIDHFLLSMQGRSKINFTLPSMKELMTTKIVNRLRKPRSQSNDRIKSSSRSIDHHRSSKFSKRRNDKFMAGFENDENDYGNNGYSDAKNSYTDEYKDLPYIDCVATGWGKSNMTSDLNDILLKTNVPLQSTARCKDAYGSFVKIHKGHLCAGKLNGRGGTCVGDSGGPLQCRLTKNGPWILAGITSFGSGCALEGYPDVYTRTSFYMKWIRDTIENE